MEPQYRKGEYLRSGFIHKDVKIVDGINWYEAGFVCPPRHRGSYPISSAFVVAAVVSSGEAIFRPPSQIDRAPKLLSPQDIIDNDIYYNPVEGGSLSSAMDYVCHQGGLMFDCDCPYFGDRVGLPNNKFRYAPITGYQLVPSDETSLLKALSKQTVACRILATDEFLFYKEEDEQNIYRKGLSIRDDVALTWHEILCAGFDYIDGELIYSLQNSRGVDWGKEGMMSISASTAYELKMLEEMYIPLY